MWSASTKPYSVVDQRPSITVGASPAPAPTLSPRSRTAESYSACVMSPLSRIRRSEVSCTNGCDVDEGAAGGGATTTVVAGATGAGVAGVSTGGGVEGGGWSVVVVAGGGVSLGACAKAGAANVAATAKANSTDRASRIAGSSEVAPAL